MPDYSSPERMKTATERSKALVKSAEDVVLRGVRNVSWTEWGFGWLSYIGVTVRSVTGFFTGQTKKYVVAKISGGIVGAFFGPLGVYIGGTLGSMVGETISSEVVDHINDQLKGTADSPTEGALDWILSKSASTPIASTILSQNVSSLEDRHKPTVTLERTREKTAELVVRLKGLHEKAVAGNFYYCDDAYYLSLDLYQIDAVRAQVLADIANLSTYLDKIKELVKNVNTEQLNLQVVLPLTEAIVSDASLPHANSYAFNLLGRARSCSREHCYGPRP